MVVFFLGCVLFSGSPANAQSHSHYGESSGHYQYYYYHHDDESVLVPDFESNFFHNPSAAIENHLSWLLPFVEELIRECTLFMIAPLGLLFMRFISLGRSCPKTKAKPKTREACISRSNGVKCTGDEACRIAHTISAGGYLDHLFMALLSLPFGYCFLRPMTTGDVLCEKGLAAISTAWLFLLLKTWCGLPTFFGIMVFPYFWRRRHMPGGKMQWPTATEVQESLDQINFKHCTQYGRDCDKDHHFLGLTRYAIMDAIQAVMTDYVRDGKKSWIAAESGSLLVGYDVTAAIEQIFNHQGLSDFSVAEVFYALGHPGVQPLKNRRRCRAFISHRQQEQITETLRAIQRYVSREYVWIEPFFWLDYVNLRQCKHDFDPKTVESVITEAGSTLLLTEALYSGEPPQALGRTFCAFEMLCTMKGGCRLGLSEAKEVLPHTNLFKMCIWVFRTACRKTLCGDVYCPRRFFGVHVNLGAATSRSPKDDAEIKNRIEEKYGGIDKANFLLSTSISKSIEEFAFRRFLKVISWFFLLIIVRVVASLVVGGDHHVYAHSHAHRHYVKHHGHH